MDGLLKKGYYRFQAITLRTALLIDSAFLVWRNFRKPPPPWRTTGEEIDIDQGQFLPKTDRGLALIIVPCIAVLNWWNSALIKVCTRFYHFSIEGDGSLCIIKVAISSAKHWPYFDSPTASSEKAAISEAARHRQFNNRWTYFGLMRCGPSSSRVRLPARFWPEWSWSLLSPPTWLGATDYWIGLPFEVHRLRKRSSNQVWQKEIRVLYCIISLHGAPQTVIIRDLVSINYILTSRLL